jgi:hypothetical protein
LCFSPLRGFASSLGAGFEPSGMGYSARDGKDFTVDEPGGFV